MFLYFVPGLPGKVNEIDAWKDRIDGAIKRECKAGPNGQPGVILADKSYPGVAGYFPNQQRWEQDGELWVGHLVDRPTTPELLARSTKISGHAVRLGDGNDWTIPAAYRSPEMGVWQAGLPRAFGVDHDGQWCYGEIKPGYRDLWEAASRFYNAWISLIAKSSDKDKTDEETTLSLPDELDIASLAIETNYRVGRREISMLGLLDEQTAGQVLLALIDWPTVEDRASKKKQPDS